MKQGSLRTNVLLILFQGVFGTQLLCAQNTSLQTTITLENPTVTQREPVILDVTFANTTGSSVEVDLGYAHDKLTVHVIDEQGRQLNDSQSYPREGKKFKQVLHLEDGSSSTAFLVLSNRFVFDKIGMYKIEVNSAPTLGSSTSNTPVFNAVLNLAVLPRDEGVLKSSCSKLVARIWSSSDSESQAAAEALSSVNDAIAVPFLVDALKFRQFTPLMVSGLARVRTDAAVAALVSATRSIDPETRTLARSALAAIEGSPNK